MNRNVVARIVVGLFLVGLLVCSSGCSGNFSKGRGTLFESHTYIGKAPFSHQWGVNNPLAPKRTGPADKVASHPIINPHSKATQVKPIAQSNSKKRLGRDYH